MFTRVLPGAALWSIASPTISRRDRAAQLAACRTRVLDGGCGLPFRRFVDCPSCNTHFAEVRRRSREIEAAGVKEVIVFHSSARSIRSYQKDVPFALVDDPKKALYKEFGVEIVAWVPHPQVPGRAMRGVAHSHFGLRLSGGPFGLPADFLIAPSGQIEAMKYGTHAYHQWSVDELIGLARGATLQAA
jgi:hypothetical protein